MNGLHLDLKWPMYTPAYIRHILKTAKVLGIDTILLEFENKILIDWLRSAVHPDHWTTADLKELLRQAKRDHFTVIPMVPLMGHLEWVLQWPWWAHLQENRDRRELCPSHPEAPAFARRLLETVLHLFPEAPFIHLGGDETYSLATCPACKARGKTKGEIYLDHFQPLFRQVRAAGKRPMIYGDMILAHPEIIDEVPREVVICDWDYWSGHAADRILWGHGTVNPGESWAKVPPTHRRYREYFVAGKGRLTPFPYTQFLKDKGFDVVLCSAAKSSGDNYCAPRTKLHVANAMAAAKRARQVGLDGVIVTSWAVRFNHLETNWPGIAASAWTYQDPSLDDRQVSAQFAEAFFGCSWPALFDDLDFLSPGLPDLHSQVYDPFPPDIVHAGITSLYRDPAGQPAKILREKQPAVERSFRQGLERLRRHEGKVTRNVPMYGIWQLAAETLLHKAKLAPALATLVQGGKVPSAVRARGRQEMARLIDQTRTLFRKTMGPVSLDTEIKLRFADSLSLI